jgi:hypothetical protein
VPAMVTWQAGDLIPLPVLIFGCSHSCVWHAGGAIALFAFTPRDYRAYAYRGPAKVSCTRPLGEISLPPRHPASARYAPQQPFDESHHHDRHGAGRGVRTAAIVDTTGARLEYLLVPPVWLGARWLPWSEPTSGRANASAPCA